MSTSLVDALNRRVEAAQMELKHAVTRRSRDELTCSALDQRPMQEFESSSSLFSWHDSLSVSIYYRVPAIRDMIPVIEFFENLLSVNATSYDSEETGARNFGFDATESLFLQVNLYVSPDEGNPDATCRRVVIGEDTVTERRPRYEIVCN